MPKLQNAQNRLTQLMTNHIYEEEKKSQIDKTFKSNPVTVAKVKKSLKLDGVGPVDNRPSTD